MTSPLPHNLLVPDQLCLLYKSSKSSRCSDLAMSKHVKGFHFLS